MPDPTSPPILGPQRAVLAPLLALCLLAVLCLAPREVCAQDAPAATTQLTPPMELERAPSHTPGPSWYGWQTILADVGAFGVMALGGGLERPFVSFLGLAGYVVASPIVHLVHGNSWAIGSLLLRVAGPALVLGGIAVTFAGCPFFGNGECNGGSQAAGAFMAIGGLGLIVATPIIDAILAVDRPTRSRVAITPWLSPRADAAGVTFSGRL